jgi:hypothetical protein
MLRDAIKHLKDEEVEQPPLVAAITPALARLKHHAHRRTKSADIHNDGQPPRRSLLARSNVAGEYVEEQPRTSARGSERLERSSATAAVVPISTAPTTPSMGNARGSFRNFFAGAASLSVADSTLMEDNAVEVEGGRRKRVLDKLLRRGRAGSISGRPHTMAVEALWNGEDDSDSDTSSGGARKLERSDSVVIHDDPAPLVQQQQPIGASGRMRGGAVLENPQRTLDVLEDTLTRVLLRVEDCRVPLRELEAMTAELDGSASDATKDLQQLQDALEDVPERVLRAYEGVATTLVSDALLPKIRFRHPDIRRVNEHLSGLERLIVRASRRRTSYWPFLAIGLGALLAVFLKTYRFIT